MVSLEPLTHKLIGIWTNHHATISSLLPHSSPTKAESLTKLKIYNWNSEEGGRTNNGLVILNSGIRKYSKSIPLALQFFFHFDEAQSANNEGEFTRAFKFAFAVPIKRTMKHILVRFLKRLVFLFCQTTQIKCRHRCCS
jgi:hypothetical protein